MTSEEALILIVRMAGFKLLVRANRLGCDNDLARLAHDNVIAVLDAWRANLADHIDIICSVAREIDTQKQDDLAHHLRHCDNALDRYWHLGEPYDVGGWHNVEDGFISPLSGEPIDIGCFPVAQAIPDNPLCGLNAILDDIAIECRLAIRPAIVFYKVTPMPASARNSMMPFDPDAEMPW